MKILLDTHILLWVLTDDPRLPAKARKLIENPGNEIFYSIVSPWEVEIKHAAHPDAMTIGGEALSGFCVQAGFQQLPIRAEHVFLLSSLRRPPDTPPHHDPFDRILVCQAMGENMIFVTHDALIAGYEEPCVYKV